MLQVHRVEESDMTKQLNNKLPGANWKESAKYHLTCVHFDCSTCVDFSEHEKWDSPGRGYNTRGRDPHKTAESRPVQVGDAIQPS